MFGSQVGHQNVHSRLALKALRQFRTGQFATVLLVGLLDFVAGAFDHDVPAARGDKLRRQPDILIQRQIRRIEHDRREFR